MAEDSSRGPGPWIAGIAAAVALYLLSPAPVAAVLQAVHGKHDTPPAVQSALQVVYAPIVLAVDRCPPVERFYEAYFKMCGID